MNDELKCVSIPAARRLANEHGMSKLIILGIDGRGNFAFTTFGRTKAMCDAMRRWADMKAPGIALMMDEVD